jgi:hypothetical protein
VSQCNSAGPPILLVPPWPTCPAPRRIQTSSGSSSLAELLEGEDYVAAFALTEHISEMNWSPDLIRYVIKAYGNSHPDQKVTLAGQATDVTQKTFHVFEAKGGLVIKLNDIHVM